MIKSVSDPLLAELEVRLKAFEFEARPTVLNLQLAYDLLDDYIVQLHGRVMAVPVLTAEQRIVYYKEVLPGFLALKIYCQEVFLMEGCRLSAAPDKLIVFLSAELDCVSRFYRQYGFYYSYYRHAMGQMDRFWFLEEEGLPEVLSPGVPLPSGIILPSCSYLFARFMALDRLEKYLMGQISLLRNPVVASAEDVLRSKKRVVSAGAKMQVNLSVDQLGLAARAALDSSIVMGKSFQSLCEELAPRISTPGKEVVSPGSLRSNAYTGEDVDKHTIIRYLEKMIRLIREY